MRNSLRATVLAALCAAPAAAGGRAIRLSHPSLPLSQPRVRVLPTAPVMSLRGPAPSLTPPLLQPAALPAPVVETRRPATAVAMPALESAASLANFYDRSAPVPLEKDPVTGLYGVSLEQRRAIVDILKKHYGANLLDLAAIGSRAKGKASALKHERPATSLSDLDLAPLLRETGGGGPDRAVLKQELEAAVGFPIELHGVLTTSDGKFGDHVPFYGGGYETWESFSRGDAVRIPLD